MEKPFPTNLIEAIQYFADPQLAFTFVVKMRWPDGEITCPRCTCGLISFISTRKVWKCLGCKRQFSIKVGTIFEDSSLGFDKWLPAIWLVANSKNGIFSHELSRALGVTQKSTWFMLHRIRHAMASGTFQKLDGTVEVDETYVGGLAKNMHKHVREARITGTGGVNKVAIQGALQRGGPVTATVVESTDHKTLQDNVREWVESGATIYTDDARAYIGLDDEYTHGTVKHSAKEFVKGDVYTNGIENFWMLYKRAWRGTYTHNSKEHTIRYVDERTFSFNNRETDDLERMMLATAGADGRRLTWDELTEKAA